jgi:hypothetical protein
MTRPRGPCRKAPGGPGVVPQADRNEPVVDEVAALNLDDLWVAAADREVLGGARASCVASYSEKTEPLGISLPPRKSRAARYFEMSSPVNAFRRSGDHGLP